MYTPTMLVEQVTFLREHRTRYPVILIQGPPGSGKTKLLRQAADALAGVQYVDYLKEVMCGSDPPVFGAFAFHEFLDWMVSQARSAPIFVDEADPLFSTWPDSKRLIFWRRLLTLEATNPVVVTTRFEETEPPDRGHGVGLVWRFSQY